MSLRRLLVAAAVLIVPRLSGGSDPPTAQIVVAGATTGSERVGRVLEALRSTFATTPYRIVDLPPAPSRAARRFDEGVSLYGQLRAPEAIEALSESVTEAERTGAERLSRQDLALLHVHHAMALLLGGDDSRAQWALDRSVAVDADLVLDPAEFPPWIRNAHAEALRREAARPSGTLALETDPPNARLYLDGAAIGTSPQRVAPVRYGVHLLRAEMEGRRAAVGTIELREPEGRHALTLSVDVAGALAADGPAIAQGEPEALDRFRRLSTASFALVLRIEDQGEHVDLEMTLRDAGSAGLASSARARVRGDLQDLDRRLEAMAAALSVLPQRLGAIDRPAPALRRTVASPPYARWWFWLVTGIVATGALTATAIVLLQPGGFTISVRAPR